MAEKKDIEELTEDEKWMVIEGMTVSYYQTTDEKLQERFGKLLDKLSPNWRDADSCQEVKSNKIICESV